MANAEVREAEQLMAIGMPDDEHKIGIPTYEARVVLGRLLRHFQDTDQKPVADAIRFGFKPHDYEPTTIDCGGDCCGGNCVIDICKRCGQAADSDNWTEFCVIDYPEPDEQPPKVGQ